MGYMKSILDEKRVPLSTWLEILSIGHTLDSRKKTEESLKTMTSEWDSP